MSSIRRNPMNGIRWRPSTISSTSPNISIKMMQNPNEPTFMLDLASVIEALIRSPRRKSQALELCKSLAVEYQEGIYIESSYLTHVLKIFQENRIIDSMTRRDFMEFWEVHFEELMTEYPRRDARVEGPNSSDEDNPDIECYMYAQYGECSNAQCKYKHPGANLLTPREYKEAVREDRARMIRQGITLPRLSRRESKSAKRGGKRGRYGEEDEEEYDPREDEEEDEGDEELDEEGEDEAMMDMIIGNNEDDDGDVGEDDIDEDYIHEPQHRAMDFSERETIINLNTQTISSLTAAGQYFLARQRIDGEIMPHYDRVLQEIDAGVTNAVNELQRFTPVGSQAAIQVQEDLGDEYLDSAVRVTKRVVELGHSLRDLDNDDFRRMMKEVGIRASDLHKQVFGKKPKKVAMSMGRGGRKYFNYYSERTAPRTLDVAIGEWFRNRAQDMANEEIAVRQLNFGDKRPRLAQEEEIQRDEEAEFNALIEEAENQPENCPNCDDGHLERGSCINNCGYHEAIEEIAEAHANTHTPSREQSIISNFFGYKI